MNCSIEIKGKRRLIAMFRLFISLSFEFYDSLFNYILKKINIIYLIFHFKKVQ